MQGSAITYAISFSPENDLSFSRKHRRLCGRTPNNFYIIILTEAQACRRASLAALARGGTKRAALISRHLSAKIACDQNSEGFPLINYLVALRGGRPFARERRASLNHRQ
jgi:hypothetical protein